MNITFRDNGNFQFIFFLGIKRSNVIIVTSGVSFIVKLVPCFLLLRLQFRKQLMEQNKDIRKNWKGPKKVIFTSMYHYRQQFISEEITQRHI